LARAAWEKSIARKTRACAAPSPSRFFLAKLRATPNAALEFWPKPALPALSITPGSPTIYEVGEEGDQIFIVMELVSGKTVRAILPKDPWSRAFYSVWERTWPKHWRLLTLRA